MTILGTTAEEAVAEGQRRRQGGPLPQRHALTAQTNATKSRLVFGSTATGSFSLGQILANYGSTTVNEVVLPIIVTAGTSWRGRGARA
jgi:hypothetical protein